MIYLIKLILAHFIGDFLLQPKSWLEEKETLRLKSLKLYLHVIIHGVIAILLLWNISQWRVVLWIMASHLIIDLIKVYVQNAEHKADRFLAGQLMHIASVIGIWIWFFKPELNVIWLESTNFWVYMAALIFITVVSGVMMQELMSGWSRALNDSNEESLNNAGKYIGILERIFVFVFVLTDNWEGIGFLLAAKSVFRFGDLKESKDRKLTEYILIGTLLSFSIAAGVGMLVLQLIEK